MSFLVIGSNGSFRHTVEKGAPTDSDVDLVGTGSAQWFKFSGIDFKDQIHWTSSLRRMQETVIRMARQVEPEIDTIFFAAQPWLMQLPIQHLFMESSSKGTLVCLVPNFSFLTWRRRSAGGGELCNHLSKDDDPEMKFLVSSVCDLSNAYRRSVEQVIVTIVGHGFRGEKTGLPKVSLGGDEFISSAIDWLDVMKGDVAVLHSCHLGSTDPVVIGDLGGIVGLAFSTGCQTFIGPVSEIYAETASSYHRILLSADDDIGGAYMSAIRENGEVVLYSFFGDPCLRLSKSRKEDAAPVASEALSISQ